MRTGLAAVAPRIGVVPVASSDALGASAVVGFVPRTDHIAVLDGLRGIAVLLVVWSHCDAVTGRTPLRLLNYALQPDYLGVDIFFVLSGFLITRILLANKARQRPVRNFLVRRFLRIFPIYYLTLAVVGWFVPGAYLVWCAVYLSNFYLALNYQLVPLGHTWSLAVEEHFYLIWPFVVHGLSWRHSRAVAFGFLPLAVLSAVVVLWFRHALPNGGARLVYMGSMFRISSLALGALFAFYENTLRADTRRPWIMPLIFLLPALVIIPVGKFVVPGLTPITKMIGFSMLSSAIFLAALELRDSLGWSAWMLRGAALTFLGRISYGLYLYHFPIFYALGVTRHATPPAVMAVVAVGLSIAVATTSFYLIERPILQLKERFQ